MQEESEFCKKCGECEYRLYPLTTNDCPMVEPADGWESIPQNQRLPFCCPKQQELGSVSFKDIVRLNPPPRGMYMRECMPYFKVVLFKVMKGE